MPPFKHEEEEYDADFDGVFRFTNPTAEDFDYKWNNIIYTYPAMQTVPMVIKNETPEHVQQIRKYAAKALAEREYYKTKGFKEIRNGLKNKEMGYNVIASSYNESELQPWVDQCLKSLPIGKAKVHKVEDEDLKLKASKPIGKGSTDGQNFPTVDLNAEFKESNAQMLAGRV
jgi:hypothetical protein